MRLKLTLSLLFCPSSFAAVSVDEMTDLMVVSDPKQTDDSTNILTLGMSAKQSRELQKT